MAPFFRRKLWAYEKARNTNKDRDWKRFIHLEMHPLLACTSWFVTSTRPLKSSAVNLVGGKRLRATCHIWNVATNLAPPPGSWGNIAVTCTADRMMIEANFIFNRQFSSVFTSDSTKETPDLGTSSYPSMLWYHFQHYYLLPSFLGI